MGLYYRGKIYDHGGADSAFVKAVAKNVRRHSARCPEYAAILARAGFSPDEVKTIADLHKIPPIPTAFLKNHTLLSVPERRLLFKSTTSGTGGRVSRVGLDFSTAFRGAGMVLGTLLHHKILSPRPVNYILLGYQPAPHNKTGIAKTAYATTKFAPAKSVEFALKDNGSSYDLNVGGVKRALIRYAREGAPVRLTGFPAYLMFVLNGLKEDGIRLKLHPKSLIMLGGGWKQFFAERVDKPTLYALSEEVLGIGGARFKEFFGVVEHPVVYMDCPNHRFHVPVYSRVIIRGDDMRPVGFGTPGILNLVTPIMTAMPHTSILTDDLAVLRPGEECGCGCKSPYFEILGRVGLAIKTCAATASDLLKP
jgi:phenylacetate-coenzyme A ligase PaaK-like adenylate-forming protein